MRPNTIIASTGDSHADRRTHHRRRRSLLRPRLRRRPRWDAAVAKVRALFERACVRLRGLCGNSKTIAVAYAAELLGVLDEAKVLDWSQLLGADSAGRVMVIM